MLKTYRYLAMAIGTLVVVQAAAIAFAMFGLAHDVDSNGVVVDKNYDGNAGFAVHAIVGQMLIPLLALVLLIIGIVVRKSPGALRWAVIVFALVALQVVLAFASFGVPIIGALHGTNALLILLASLKAVTVVPREPAAATA
jgi:heme A synthase